MYSLSLGWKPLRSLKFLLHIEFSFKCSDHKRNAKPYFKIKNCVSCIPLIRVNLSKITAYTHKKNTFTRIFAAALFIIAKNLGKSKYPLTGKWVAKVWCSHTMEYYSAKKGTTDIYNNMHAFQSSMLTRRAANKGLHTLWFPWRKIQEPALWINSNRGQTNGRMGSLLSGKGHKEIFWK